MGQEQTFVDDRIAGQAGNVEVFPTLDRRLPDRIFDALADHIEFPFELSLVENVSGDEDLTDGRLRPTRLRTNRIALDRHIAPAQEARPLFRNHLLKERLALFARAGILGQEDHPDAIFSGVGKLHTDIGCGALQELVRDLEENPGSITGTGITALRATMVEVLQDLQALLHHAVGLVPLDVDYKPDPAAVFFEPGIVEPLFWR